MFTLFNQLIPILPIASRMCCLILAKSKVNNFEISTSLVKINSSLLPFDFYLSTRLFSIIIGYCLLEVPTPHPHFHFSFAFLN